MSQQQMMESGQKQVLQKVCPQCGKSFTINAHFVDHLFASKECMRRYWADVEADRARRYGHKTPPQGSE